MEECCFADAGSVLGCPSLVRWRYAELQEDHVCIEGVELPKDIDKGSTLQMPSFLCGKRVVSIGQGDSWAVDFPDLSAHNICKVIIPEGVQRLSGVLFRGCASIREIILPRTLRSIGSEVFSQCEAEIFACISDVRYIGSWCLGALDKTKTGM